MNFRLEKRIDAKTDIILMCIRHTSEWKKFLHLVAEYNGESLKESLIKWLSTNNRENVRVKFVVVDVSIGLDTK